MGTNYYLSIKPPCECCGRPFEQLHIGKSSGGWCFSLHVIPEQGINDLEDWRKEWSKPGVYIENEYGTQITPEGMYEVITERTWLGGSKQRQEWFAQNQAEPGPNNLARHVLDGRHCVKHGAGTWDCITGEFS